MSAASRDNHPFPIQFEVEFLDRLNEPVRAGKAKSVSEIIRCALARFDLSKVVVVKPPHVLISVRLPAEKRDELRREAAAKHTNVGQLVRAAVEAFLPQLESGAVGQMEMAIEIPPTPTATPAKEKAARPARAKKAGPATKPRAKPSRPAAAKSAKAPRPRSQRSHKPKTVPPRSARR